MTDEEHDIFVRHVKAESEAWKKYCEKNKPRDSIFAMGTKCRALEEALVKYIMAQSPTKTTEAPEVEG